MKVDRAAYTKTFPVGVYWEKILLECSLDDTDDPIKAVLILKEEVEKAHKLANPQLYKNGEAIVEAWDALGDIGYDSYNGNKFTKREPPKVINRLYERMEVEIDKCTSLEELSAHKEFVSKNPDLMSAYTNKLKSLTDKIKV